MFKGESVPLINSMQLNDDLLFGRIALTTLKKHCRKLILRLYIKDLFSEQITSIWTIYQNKDNPEIQSGFMCVN